MRKTIILISVTLSLPRIGQAQFDTLYMNLQPNANEVLTTLRVQGDEYWSFGKAINLEGDHFRIKKVNGQGEVLEVLDSTAYAPYIYIYGAGTIATSDNGFLLASEFVINGTTACGKTIKFNNDLSIAWSHIEENIYTDSTDFALDFAAEISDKAYIVSGWYRWTDADDWLGSLRGQVVMKIDSSGNTVWTKTELQTSNTGFGIRSQELIELDNGELVHLRWFGDEAAIDYYHSYIELQRLSADGTVIEDYQWDEAYHYGIPAAIVKDGYLYMIYGIQEDVVQWSDPLHTDCRFKKFNLETWQEEWDVAGGMGCADGY